MSHKTSHHNSNWNLFLLSFAAIGVVFGDIGTSPLYAINEIFFGHSHLAHTASNEVGVISLVIWILTLVVSIKYVVFVLRADNAGSGGVFALYEILRRVKYNKFAKYMTGVLILAAGLLIGDGIITPAISVLSAVEGVRIAIPSASNYVIPITISILTGLFLIQSKGTHVVGRFFGPVITTWFVTLAILGLINIIRTPNILLALNPYYAISFVASSHITQLLTILGSVMLTITGGEALFADMGHFGSKPIRIAWYFLAYPALILQYLGQGAYLLSGEEVLNNNIFYSMVPGAFLLPLIVLATLATVIASQALITGAFSLVSQGIGIGLIPFTKIDHTHESHEGQVYIPLVNFGLYIGCIILVLWFKTSSNLASAYGLAVSADMFITSICMIIIASKVWKWKSYQILFTFVVFALIDFSFLVSNSLKFFQGGYVPLSIGIFMFVIMSTWKWGKDLTHKAYLSTKTPRVEEFIKQLGHPLNHFEEPIIILSRDPVKRYSDRVPRVLSIFWKKYHAAPSHLLILTIRTKSVPYVLKDRFKIYKFDANSYEGEFTSVVANYGYMENQTVGKVIDELSKHSEFKNGIPLRDWILQIGQDRLIVSENMSLFRRVRFSLYRFLKNVASPSYHHMGLRKSTQLFIEVYPITIH